MALPTRNQVRTVILAWWQEPGRPRLTVLRARLSALVTMPHSARAAVVCRIADVPPLTMFVELVTWDVDGNQSVAASLLFDATDIPPGGAGRADLDDVSDGDDKRTRRQIRDAPNLLGAGK